MEIAIGLALVVVVAGLIVARQSSARDPKKQAKRHVGEAEFALAQGDVERGMSLLNQAVEVDPTNGSAHRHLAGYHLSRGDLEPARRHIDQARQDPLPSAETCRLDADIALHEGAIDRARQCLQEGMELEPESASLWRAKGDVERAVYWGGLSEESDPLRKAHALFERHFPPALRRKALEFDDELPDEPLVDELEDDEKQTVEKGLVEVKEAIDTMRESVPSPPFGVDLVPRHGEPVSFRTFADRDPSSPSHFECLDGDRLTFLPFKDVESIVFDKAHLWTKANVRLTDGQEKQLRIAAVYRSSVLAKNPQVIGGATTVWRPLIPGLEFLAGQKVYHTEEMDVTFDNIASLHFRTEPLPDDYGQEDPEPDPNEGAETSSTS